MLGQIILKLAKRGEGLDVTVAFKKIAVKTVCQIRRAVRLLMWQEEEA
jgi:hypothetical protein